jgi:hypothetical protein
VEPGVYLIAACLPSLRPLFKHAIESASVVSIRGRFQSHNSRVGGSKNASSGIVLSAVERSKGTSMGDRGPRIGFQRLDDPRVGDIEQKGLVVSYRGSDAYDGGLASNSVSDLEERHWEGNGIKGQKTYKGHTTRGV